MFADCSFWVAPNYILLNFDFAIHALCCRFMVICSNMVQVEKAACILAKDPDQVERLVAYIQSADVDLVELENALRDRIPSNQVPFLFQKQTRLPASSTGEVINQILQSVTSILESLACQGNMQLAKMKHKRKPTTVCGTWILSEVVCVITDLQLQHDITVAEGMLSSSNTLLDRRQFRAVHYSMSKT